MQDLGRLGADVARRGDEADQVLDQRLGDRAIGIVVGHVIAHAVGAPAEAEFGEVTGADHHAALLVGETEEVVRAQARLHVLKGDVIDLLAAAERMADIGQHLRRRRLDVDLRRRDAQRLHQPPGIGVGFVRRAEARHRVGEDVLAAEAEAIHRPADDDQRMGRIEAARHADDGILGAARLQALRQSLDLDVVGLVAIVAQLGRIGRHIGEALDGALQRHALLGRIEREGKRPEALDPLLLLQRAIGEAVVAQALLPDATEVDVGLDHRRVLLEARGLDELVTDLVDRGMAVPGEIGRRFARPRRRIGIGRDRPHRLAAAQQPPRLGLADGDVAGRQVHQQLGARERGVARRRDRHPHVLADLDMEGEIDAGCLEEEIGAERHGLAQQLDLVAEHVGAGDEMPLLVELAIVRQVGLWHHAQHLAAMDDDGGVVEAARDPERRADDQDREELARGLDDLGDRPLDLVQQRVLQQQVLDGIGGQAEFGEDHDGGARLVALRGELQGLGEIVGGIGHAGARHAARHAHELMGIERVEIGHRNSSHAHTGAPVGTSNQGLPE